jgi:hypothetical protein
LGDDEVEEEGGLYEFYDWVAPKVAMLDYRQIGHADKVHEFTGAIVPGKPFVL